ncbi:MAG TPA: ankyrin repeat domain-containing protein [Candidatus Acidoferrales bacterium]|nr:ankyrin repeat domain-containing protein [Candidatus Acidoferrales bacterium]
MSGTVSNSYPTRRLPKQPSLEQLRKQAKELLEQYRAGDAAAIAEIQQFERRPNPAAFALNDAQRVLARAYGYESWPKLKAFIDGANIARLAEAVRAGDAAQVRTLLSARPELVAMDMAGNDEHRVLHYAVLRRDAAMVKLLMEAGADARKGIYPHRDATSALAIAKDREYGEIVAVIEEEERLRRAEMSCPNATISPIQDQIHQAISKSDNAAAIRLLQADGSLIQACDRDGGTPLHVAAQATNEEMVLWLLNRRAQVRKQDMRGLTPLDRASLAVDPRNEDAKRFPAVAKLLMEHGAEVTIRAAVALADKRRVREMVSENPAVLREIHWANGGLLTLAVNHGHIEIVQLLLELGADVDERVMLTELEEPTPSWGTPLWYAALAGQRDIVELLLDRGADPNANVYASGWPLRNACRHRDDSVKRLLLARGAKPQPYMIAEAHDVDGARRLLETDTSSELAKELAWSAADHGCPAIVELALKRIGWPGDDPRWHRILIQPIRGVGTNHPDHEGHFKCMELLLRHGIEANVARFGQTPLHFAAARHGELSGAERARFAAMLLDHGARLDLRDELLKSTPLGWACRWGRKELVELLIARGAPVNELDAEPWATPRAWAEKMNQDAVLAVLRQNEC